jgi:hydrogenase/urease accessory protein HupE
MTTNFPHRMARASTKWPGFVCLFFFSTGFVFGHNPITSWAVVQLHADHMELKVELATESAWLFLGETLESAPAVEGSLPRLKAKAVEVYRLSTGGRILQPRETGVELREEDGVEFRLVFERPAAGPIHFEALYLKRLPPDHRTTVTMIDEADKVVRSELLNAKKLSVDIDVPRTASFATTTPIHASAASSNPVSPAPSVTPPPSAVSFPAFLNLGIEHILTGYDHLLFLLGLLVVCRRIPTMLAIITCFTLAHSLTLALAALNVVSISSRVVEPLIAASIVFVGVENLVRREEPKGRWLLTFAFGLIHGFGFAGVLRNVGLGAGGSSLVIPLFSFNLGVELGQLAVVGIMLPVLWQLRKHSAFVRYGEPGISVVVLLLGAYWLLQRTFFS